MKIFTILLISLFFRFIYLGVIPVSLAHDEIDNVIQAYSLRYTGYDIEHSMSPWSLLPNSGVMAELGSVINLPAITFLPPSLFTFHFTTALLSSLYPLLILALLFSLGVPSFVAWTTSILLAISPWHIIFSRTALEQPTSLFFYTSSWIFLINIFKSAKSSRFYITNFLFFALTYCTGFFTYHGYKFALPILTLIIFAYLVHKYYKAIRWYQIFIPLLVIIGLILRVLFYTQYYASRQSEIILSQTEKFANTVDVDRRLSLVDGKVDTLFSNKSLALYDTLKSKYLMAISPELLFISGESNGVFSVGRSGYLYLVSLPFLIVGLVYLLYYRRPLEILFVALLLVSPLASVIHINNSLAFRSGIYFVVLNIVIAYGIFAVYNHLRSRAVLVVVGLLFFVGISRFSYAYFAIHPVESSTAYFFADRLLGNYLSHSEDQRILVIDPQPRYVMSNWLLSKKLITPADMKGFGGSYSPSDLDIYQVGNVTIMRDCPKDTSLTYDTVIVSRDIVAGLEVCPAVINIKANPKILSRALVSPADSGMEKLILGDTVCADQELTSYIHPQKPADFELGALNRVQFCHNWVVEQ